MSVTAPPMLAFAEPGDEEWKNTKAQRAALRAKYDGRCAYCGVELGKAMHADHREPCIRITTDPWSRPLPAAERRMIKPDRNTVGNMMPACAPCNLHKGGYPLEQWRAYLQRSADIVRKQTSTFRAGERFGIITVSAQPIVFHFERVANGEATSKDRGRALMAEAFTASRDADPASYWKISPAAEMDLLASVVSNDIVGPIRSREGWPLFGFPTRIDPSVEGIVLVAPGAQRMPSNEDR